MANREIQGITGPREAAEEPLVWKPWQPPVMGPVATSADAGVEAVSAVVPVAAPRLRSLGADQLHIAALGAAALPRGEQVVDIDALGAGLDAIDRTAAARALGALGTVQALGEVAAAYARTTFSPDAIVASLTRLAGNLGEVSDTLQALPGVGAALGPLGGAGAVASGVLGLRDALTVSAGEGRSGLSRALGAASGAAKLVGGLALALGAVAAEAAPLGVAILAAGTALELGKLAWDNRADAKKLLGQAKEALLPVISNNGASFSNTQVPDTGGGLNPLRVVANNGARMSGPFGWLGV